MSNNENCIVLEETFDFSRTECSNVNNSTTVSPVMDIHHPPISREETIENGNDHISKPVTKVFGNNMIEKGMDIVAKCQIASSKIGCLLQRHYEETQTVIDSLRGLLQLSELNHYSRTTTADSEETDDEEGAIDSRYEIGMTVLDLISLFLDSFALQHDNNDSPDTSNNQRTLRRCNAVVAILRCIQCVQPTVEVLSNNRQTGSIRQAQHTISVVEFLKMLLRLYLLRVQRTECDSNDDFMPLLHEDGIVTSSPDITTVQYEIGQRTGRLIQLPSNRAENYNKKNARIWNPPVSTLRKRQLAEYLYVLRPFLWSILTNLRYRMHKDKRPWMLAVSWLVTLLLDMTSLKLHRQTQNIPPFAQSSEFDKETTELKRRTQRLSLYFLRSPMWDIVTNSLLQSKLMQFMIPISFFRHYVISLLRFYRKNHYMLDG